MSILLAWALRLLDSRNLSLLTGVCRAAIPAAASGSIGLRGVRWDLLRACAAASASLELSAGPRSVPVASTAAPNAYCAAAAPSAVVMRSSLAPGCTGADPALTTGSCYRTELLVAGFGGSWSEESDPGLMSCRCEAARVTSIVCLACAGPSSTSSSLFSPNTSAACTAPRKMPPIPGPLVWLCLSLRLDTPGMRA